MIKKIRQIYKPYMIHAIIYQSGTKIAVALVLSLLWDRFLNKNQLRSMAENAFFVAAAVFFMLAWFQYLRLDGMTIHHMFEERKKKKKKKRIHFTKDIVDFADEKIIPFAELESEERTVCRLLGDLGCGLLFLVICLIALVV